MRLKYLLWGGLAVLTLGLTPRLSAQTLWTGPNTNFTQFAPNSDDFLTPEISLTRAGTGVLFNDSSSPTPDTALWAQNPSGNINNYAALSYAPMENYRDGTLNLVLLSTPWVMQLTNEQIYIEVTFTEWTRHGGPFAYTRSTPAAVTPPPTPVKLFSPTLSGGSFIFSYSNATPGLTYIVQSSSNLSAWTPVSTNIASGSTVSFTNTLTTGAHYFRVQTQ